MRQQGNTSQIPIKRDRPEKEIVRIIVIITMKENKSSRRKKYEKNE